MSNKTKKLLVMHIKVTITTTLQLNRYVWETRRRGSARLSAKLINVGVRRTRQTRATLPYTYVLAKTLASDYMKWNFQLSETFLAG